MQNSMMMVLPQTEIRVRRQSIHINEIQRNLKAKARHLALKIDPKHLFSISMMPIVFFFVVTKFQHSFFTMV